MFGIKDKVADTAKRAGLLSGGLLFCLVGLGFLTVSGWFALLPILGVQTTALVIAGAYLGIGLIMIGVGSQSRQRVAPHPATQPEPTSAPQDPPMMQAFMYGLQAGSQANRSRRS